MKTYLAVILGSALVAMVATPLAIRLARRLRIVDAPGPRKVHATAVPRAGGMAIVAAMLALVIPVITLDNAIGASFRLVHEKVLALLLGGLVIFAVGLLDDLRGLRARTKLLAEIIAAGAMCAAGIRIDEITLPGAFTITFGPLACPVTILWIVGVTNALNLIDGLDGLAAGIAAITCGVIAVLAIVTGQPVMAVLMLALLGSLCGFLVFNFNPARIFMGDCGSLFLGFTLGTASVLSAMKTATLVGLALPLLALGVPLFDMLFSMLRRMLDRRSPFSPDRGHIHHRLLDLGLSQRRAVLALYSVTAGVATLALCMLVTRDATTVGVFVALLAALVGLFRLVGAVRLRESLAALQRNLAIRREMSEERRQFEESQLRLRESVSLESWWEAVCGAAERLAFAVLSMTVTDDDGTPRTFVWKHPNAAALADRWLLLSFVTPQADPRRPVHVEAHIGVNGSVEAAARRGALFGRLIDECGPHGPSPDVRRSPRRR